MKRIIGIGFLLILVLSSCNWMGWRQIKGNGNLITQDRTVTKADKIKLEGSFDVEISQGPTTSVKVEADENLVPYIITRVEGGYLVIKTKNGVSFSSEHEIKVYVTTDKLEKVELAGSGNVTGKNKFTGGSKLELKIAGSGDIKMEINTPDILSEIAGSGSITLKGETQNETIKIAGVGDFTGDEMKAENATVKIAGSGNVKVFADMKLDVSIAGVGSVYYKGAANVTQHISGSGDVKKIE